MKCCILSAAAAIHTQHKFDHHHNENLKRCELFCLNVKSLIVQGLDECTLCLDQ
jgi:hypothetical protein